MPSQPSSPPVFGATTRDALTAECRNWLDLQRNTLKIIFEKDHDGEAYVRGYARILDQLIEQIALHFKMPGEVAIVATGGYGRGEMFPYSDVDILFLYESDNPSAHVFEPFLYTLWDLGFKVGHATRTLRESLFFARQDITIRTNLLDARFICGNKPLFEELHQRYRSEVVEGTELSFVEAKLAERDERHKRYGNSRYLLEPNLKEGKGGLRDLQTLYWITQYVYHVDDMDALVTKGLMTKEELREFERARTFYWHMRVQLHLLAGKAEERLTFDRQQALAAALGYKDKKDVKAVEQLMKQYFTTANTVGSLTRLVCAVLEDEHKRKPKIPLGWMLNLPWKLKGFSLEGGRLKMRYTQEFARDPLRMLEIFQVAQQHGLDIHPRTLQQITRHLHLINRDFYKTPRHNAVFLEILLSENNPETTLRRMNEVGLLGKFFPDFGRIVGQMQFNMYHHYTVDEHTIRAIGILHDIEDGLLKGELPLATEVVKQVQSRRVLYLALFCHDIAKGQDGDHSELGEVIALKLAGRLGFSQAEAESCAWLVRHHLVMSLTAFKRDLNDPKSVEDFVSIVQSTEQLRLLVVLTVADIRAVGPGVWNAWKGSLLRDLHSRAEAYIRTGKSSATLKTSPSALKDEMMKVAPEFDSTTVYNYFEQVPTALLTGIDIATHVRILRAIQQREGQQENVQVDITHDEKQSTSEIMLCTRDQYGLFSKLAGAITVSGANIISAKIFTLKNGLAVDLFQIVDQQGEFYHGLERLARLRLKIEQAVRGSLQLDDAIAELKPRYPERRDAFKVPPQVFIQNEVSNSSTVIEIISRDRIGLLYSITSTLSRLGLTIATAHISTYGEKAVDVFYVKDTFGMKIDHEKRMGEVKQALLECLA